MNFVNFWTEDMRIALKVDRDRHAWRTLGGTDKRCLISHRLLCYIWVVLCVSCQPGVGSGPPVASEQVPARSTASVSGSTSATAKRSPDNPPQIQPVQLPKLGAGVHQQMVSLQSGRELRYTISVPNDDKRASPLPLVVALHYGGEVTPFYGQGLIDELVGPAFQSLGAVLVAPDSLGGDWQTPDNEQAVIWLTRSVIKTYAIDPKRIALTGYSMGGMGTWFIGSRHPDLFTAAIPVAGAPAGEETWKIPLYVIHSKDDEVLPIGETRSYVEKLKAKGIDAQWRELTGITHYQVSSFTPALAEAVPWLRQGSKP